ncbi:hypothetical protein [Geodermatophilus sp. CPCC 205761]|uniref:hypothetical protein n=1 Tax=Geodermatophilus sp. CPCC 205761 TaxID=2936597 RepID=UPI003EEA0561
MTMTLPMTPSGLRDELEVDFAQAACELAEARALQAEKDTPDHRAAVAECSARLDAVLDMYLDAGFPR